MWGNRMIRACRTFATVSAGIWFHNAVYGFSVVNGQVFNGSDSGTSSSNRSLVLVNRSYGIADDWYNLFWSDKELVDKHDIRRGELVVLRHPADPNLKIMRKVVGKDGQLVKLGDDNLIAIPTGRCWLANEAGVTDQEDSHELGTLSIGLVDGTAVAIVWPPVRWKVF